MMSDSLSFLTDDAHVKREAFRNREDERATLRATIQRLLDGLMHA
jgi:hypothetical protein